MNMFPLPSKTRSLGLLKTASSLGPSAKDALPAIVETILSPIKVSEIVITESLPASLVIVSLAVLFVVQNLPLGVL